MSSLSVHLNEIPEEGLSFACDLNPDELSLASTDVHVVGPLALTTEIVRTETGARVTGLLSGQVLRECVRCLKEYQEPLQVSFSGVYQDPLSASRGGAERPEEEVDEGAVEDVYQYKANHVELVDMLREHVILSTPIQPLCSQSCLGLCQVCGQDWNQEACTCEQTPSDTRFSALRHVMEQGSKPSTVR